MVNINSQSGKDWEKDPRKLERRVLKGISTLAAEQALKQGKGVPVWERVCPLCDGTGKMILAPFDLRGEGQTMTERMTAEETCPKCKGSGVERRRIDDPEVLKEQMAAPRKIQIVKR